MHQAMKIYPVLN